MGAYLFGDSCCAPVLFAPVMRTPLSVRFFYSPPACPPPACTRLLRVPQPVLACLSCALSGPPYFLPHVLSGWGCFEGTFGVLLALRTPAPVFWGFRVGIGGAKTVASSAQTFAGDALANHQHAAISAGTPSGTNGTVAASGSAAVKVGTSSSNAAASGHTHSGPTFTGSPMATHQHDGITAGTPSGTNTPGAATSVVQPYLVVYMWKRTA